MASIKSDENHLAPVASKFSKLISNPYFDTNPTSNTMFILSTEGICYCIIHSNKNSQIILIKQNK